MPKVQIILSHPDFANSRANRALVDAASFLPEVETAHLDSLYPDGNIDVEAEVRRLLAAESFVLQFPIQWYSMPPLLKSWIDQVLTRMYYMHPEQEGNLLQGRKCLVAVTAGNRPEAYSADGVNLFPLSELLRPLHSTANRCGWIYQDPFIVFSAKHLSEGTLTAEASRYASTLQTLAATPAP